MSSSSDEMPQPNYVKIWHRHKKFVGVRGNEIIVRWSQVVRLWGND